MTQEQILSAPSNYPMPDPAWDYVEVWNRITDAHRKLGDLITYMSSDECESENHKADQIIEAKILSVWADIVSANSCFSNEHLRH